MQERGIDIRQLSPEAIDNIMSRYEERIERQADRIEELEAERDNYGDDFVCQIAAKDARIDLLDSDQKRYHAAWMAAEEDKEEQAARIKELESEITAWIADRDSWIGRYEAVRKEKDARIADQEAYIERLEAAFLEQFAQGIQAPKEKAELMAREALEKIKAETGSGDHVAGANKLILTAEQRKAIRRLIEPIEILLVDHETDLDIEDAVRELRAMLKGYVPAWKATNERIAAMKDACNFLVYAEIRNKGVNPGNVDRAKNAGDVLRAMLEEAEPCK